LGNSWRISDDCNEWPSIYEAIRTNQNLSSFASPGAWNDPDMLVGSSPLAAVYNTPAQSRTQFNLWSVMAAPLLIGSNILNITQFDLETYTNTEVILVDQDVLGKQGIVVFDNCPPYVIKPTPQVKVDPCQQVWAKPLSYGSIAVVFVNYALTSSVIPCDSSCLNRMGITRNTDFLVRDLWMHQDLGTFTNNYDQTLAGNGTSSMFIFTPLAAVSL
jgi:alpha-galactosidase